MKHAGTVLLLYLAVLFLYPFPLLAEGSIKFRQLTLEDGLSQSNITCIIQSRSDFLWFGTNDGLNRYDGNKFKIYASNTDDPNSLSGNNIRCLAEDSEGRIWVGTARGLNFIDYETEQYGRFAHDPDDLQSLRNDVVRCLFIDGEGILWIGTDKGLDRFDIQNGIFLHFDPDCEESAQLQNIQVNAIQEDSAGRLLIGTNSGLFRYDREKVQLARFSHEQHSASSIASNQIQCIHKDHDGDIWIGTAGGLNRFDDSSGGFVYYGFMKGNRRASVTAIEEDATGRLWIGTRNEALWILDRRTSKWHQKRPGLNLPGSINSSSITSIFRDRHSNMWIGTGTKGINVWNPTSYKFDLYAHEPHDTKSLSFANVRAIYLDADSILWVGGQGGLDRIDRKGGKIERLKQAHWNLTGRDIYAIYEDPDEPERYIWIGTEERGLYKYDRIAETLTEIPYYTDGMDESKGKCIFSILKDRSKLLWLGTSEGLYSFDETSGEATHFEHAPDEDGSLSHDLAQVLYEDRSGVLWVGTPHGINRFERDTGTFQRFTHDPNNPKSLCNNDILAIRECADGNLWVGTAGGGLNRFDRKSETFEHYTVEDGLPNNVINGILEDRAGNLWLSSNKGISKFDPATAISRNYCCHEGLQSGEFNPNASYISRSGEFFFGGVNGLNSFYPDSIRDDPYIPSVYITEFRACMEQVHCVCMGNGRRALGKSIVHADEVELSYKQQAFCFEFTAIHFANPGKNRFACILEGLEDEWNYIGNRRVVSYSHIPPGRYTFRVKGSNCDGLWNEEGASIQLVIKPAFWMTWWFRISAALAILVIAFILYRIRTNYIRKRNAELDGINSRLEEQIKARIRIEESLKESEAQYRRLVETAPDIIHEFSTTRGGLYYSPQVETILGYTVEHLLNNPFMLYNSIHPEDRRHLDRALKNYMSGEGIEQTYRMKDANGNWHWFNYRSIRGRKNGDETIITGIAREITDRVRIENALLMNKAAVDCSVNESLWILPDGSFGYVNDQACYALGYTREELLKMSIEDIDPICNQKFIKELWRIIRKQKKMIIETEQVCKSGRKYPVEATLSYVLLNGKEIIYRVACNITERKNSEKKLKKAFLEIKELKEQLEAENVVLRQEVQNLGHKKIVGESIVMRRLMGQTAEVAATDSTVLIMGETGTGKELLARVIHDMSLRSGHPFVAINCAAIPSTLLESELFGREKGAYTGALTSQSGRFELADGSSIFLDEIGELSLEAQAKLLRILEQGELERLGSTKTIKVNTRIIAATNKDLEKAVEEGRFRSDLYFRLNVFPIAIPPLRERREDIPALVWHFIGEFSERMGKTIESIHQNSMEQLKRYDWPGNVRELRNTIERAMILAKGPILRVPTPKLKVANIAQDMTLDEFQKKHILEILQRVDWRVRGKNGAAEILGLKPSTLESKMSKLGLHRPSKSLR